MAVLRLVVIWPAISAFAITRICHCVQQRRCASVSLEAEGAVQSEPAEPSLGERISVKDSASRPQEQVRRLSFSPCGLSSHPLPDGVRAPKQYRPERYRQTGRLQPRGISSAAFATTETPSPSFTFGLSEFTGELCHREIGANNDIDAKRSTTNSDTGSCSIFTVKR
jgi:hypothetical protein